jgi:hypothetical protein
VYRGVFSAMCISNTLNIYLKENVSNKRCIAKWNSFYARYTFSVSLDIFDILKQKGTNVPELLRYEYTPLP